MSATDDVMFKTNGPGGSRPIETAPKDGTLIRLLVEFSEHSLEDDNSKPVWTIGHNHFYYTGEDIWQFVGWRWTHDIFTDGVGEPIGWLPMVEEKA